MWVVVTYSSIETILFCWELPTEVLQLPGRSLWWSWSGRSNGYCLCSTRSKQKAREKIAAKTRGGGGWSRHLGNDKGMAQMAVLHMVWRSTSSGGLNPLVVDDFLPNLAKPCVCGWDARANTSSLSKCIGILKSSAGCRRCLNHLHNFRP